MAKRGVRPYRLTDGHGLYLDVRPSGRKFWRVRYELVHGKKRVEQLHTLGEFIVAASTRGEDDEAAQLRRRGGFLTLAEARSERDRVRGLVRQGRSPLQERKRHVAMQRKDSATTLAGVAEEWLASKQWEEVTQTRRRRMLERVVMGRLGDLPIKTISSQQLLEVLRQAASTNGPTVAAEARRSLSGIFGYAIATLRAENDPVRPIQRALPPNKTQHKRPLKEGEVGELLTAISRWTRNHQTQGALLLMWYTLCRPGEATGAAWGEIDWDAKLWRLPPERMKKRERHISPLPTQAIALLRRMQVMSGGRVHIFPHRDCRDLPMTEAALRQAIYQLKWRGRYSPHATRATGSTMLNELGYNRDWIERQLAHRDRDGARMAYNQASYIEDRRAMMQAWADRLDSLMRATTTAPFPEPG